MKRILTGVQCTGNLHLGNCLSVLIPTIELSKNDENETLIFIADLHSFTTLKDAEKLNNNLYNSASKWIALGLDYKKTLFYRQSRINGICYLTWILNCITPYKMLSNAHAFKNKSNNLSDVNVGLFDYPVLMTADILAFQPDLVIVGKDQKQHIEITRDIATTFNKTFGNIFKLPKDLIIENVGLIVGTDGRKMSKSYNNEIDIFDEENVLLKKIKSIKTDSKKQEENKNPEECIIFNIYKNLATKDQIEDLKSKYINGGLLYIKAKEALYELILEKFKEERYKFNQIKNDHKLIDNIFNSCEIKAQEMANETLQKVKSLLKLI